MMKWPHYEMITDLRTNLVGIHKLLRLAPEQSRQAINVQCLSSFPYEGGSMTSLQVLLEQHLKSGITVGYAFLHIYLNTR